MMTSEGISVSKALRLAKYQLETIKLCIIGEISEFNFKPGYSAVYFTIKDAESSLPCLIWINQYKALEIEVKLGSMVQVIGKFSLYAAKGRMNFHASNIVLMGEGKLRQIVANRAKQLQKEGLFDSEHKRPIPKYSERIGLVTSPRGAAVHDVIQTLNRRFPLAKIYLAGVPVEGVDAPSYLMHGIRSVVNAGVDVVLLVRGGGSYEDLMPFNDESLARTIYECPVPVITGIGHEPDTSIADMVADLSASTPTAAAENVSDDQAKLISRLVSYKVRIDKDMINNFTIANNFVKGCAGKVYFLDPQILFMQPALHLDNQMQNLLANFRNFMLLIKHATENQKIALMNSSQAMFANFHHSFNSNETRLSALNPDAVLDRGYSIVTDENSKVVSKSKNLKVGQILYLKFSDGNKKVKVE